SATQGFTACAASATMLRSAVASGGRTATYLRSFFLYIASIRAVTAKPPKMLTLASTTPASPSHFAAGLSAAAAAISAATMITEEIALVTAISGVCSAGVTDHTT